MTKNLSVQNQVLINEVFWLRCIACLAVTLGHAINNGYILYVEPSIYNTGTYILSIAVLFGVPVFIFISEFLLAHKYMENLPSGFMKKRIRILLLPYLFMSIVYAVLNLENGNSEESSGKGPIISFTSLREVNE